jgi:hypothetical protein
MVEGAFGFGGHNLREGLRVFTTDEVSDALSFLRNIGAWENTVSSNPEIFRDIRGIHFLIREGLDDKAGRLRGGEVFEWNRTGILRMDDESGSRRHGHIFQTHIAIEDERGIP